MSENINQKHPDTAPASVAHHMAPVLVAIVGAGAGGLCMAMKLKAAGISDFLVFERSRGVGGVWQANSYPGARCDVPSHFYSYSFAQKKDWSAVFAPQAEIRSYFQDCAARYGLTPHLRLGTAIRAAHWDEGRGHWHITDDAGNVHRARFLVMATGVFSGLNVPRLKGLDSFEGAIMHSAEWRHDVALEGRQVAIVGTGASSIQIAPAIAKRVGGLHIFQREPCWIIPKGDKDFGRGELFLNRYVPCVARLRRLKAWFDKEVGTIVKAGGRMNDRRLARALRYMETIKDPALRSRLTPDYPIGCKRVLRSDEFLQVLNESRVHVVSDLIEEVTAKGIVAGGQHIPLDVIILGTGFRTTDYLHGIDVRGAGGRNLHAEEWRSSTHAYLGLTVSGFPNMLMLYGPNTNVQTSVIHMLEHQANYCLRMIRYMVSRSCISFDVRREAMSAHDRNIQKTMKGSVWLSGCRSYFLDANRRVSTQWPYRATRYWWKTRTLKAEDYNIKTAA